MRVAIVHEWFVSIAGSERVVEQLLALYPQADVFALVADPEVISSAEFLKGRKLTTSIIQRLPFAVKAYRLYLPLMPLAVEQFDLGGYDLIISSSHAVAKGVLVGPDQVHISYVHSPMRYVWDLQHQYLRESRYSGIKLALARYLLHRLRIWDARTANGVDQFVVNSSYIGRRVEKAYRRSSIVVYPPVNIDEFTMVDNKQSFYVTASRFVPYKRIDLIVAAFLRMPNRKLIVLGDGPEFSRISRFASSNVEFRGYVDDGQMRTYLQQAQAFLFAAEEDFGILPVEAQACGTPVIAFGRGGCVESVIPLGASADPTGVLFSEQTPEAIIKAVDCFESNRAFFRADACRRNAARFSREVFRDAFANVVNRYFRN